MLALSEPFGAPQIGLSLSAFLPNVFSLRSVATFKKHFNFSRRRSLLSGFLLLLGNSSRMTSGRSQEATDC